MVVVVRLDTSLAMSKACWWCGIICWAKVMSAWL